MPVGKLTGGVHCMLELVGKIVGSAIHGHMSGGVGSSRINVGPVHCPPVVAEHLIEEDTLAAAVAIAERVDQRELGPVRGDRDGGGIAIRRARRSVSDLGEEPIELVVEELRTGVRDSKGAGVAGAQLAGPAGYALSTSPERTLCGIFAASRVHNLLGAGLLWAG